MRWRCSARLPGRTSGATEQARSQVTGADRAAASHRILDHYLHTAYVAARILKPERDPIDIAEPSPGTVAEESDNL